jgi:choline dehydrogenase
MGLSVNEDFNGESQEGAGYYQITTKGGIRMSTARAYLHPAMKRKNLTVKTKAHATRVLFDGERAVGVEFEQSGKLKQVSARKEIVLSSGAVNSPKILQLSGIGSKELLSEHGIPVVHDSPAVGQNLTDHIAITYYYRSRVQTLNDQLSTWPKKIWQGVKYVLTRKGTLSLSVNQSGGFMKSRSDLEQPNLQLYFTPVSYTTNGPLERPLMSPDPFSAFHIGVQPCHPTSRGQIEIRSKDPSEPPAIYPNSLSTNEDVREMVEGARIMQEFIKTKALGSVAAEPMMEGQEATTDEEIIDFVRANASTVFHPVSTCRMGPDNDENVVDNRLRVYGVTGLRVVDASVFPRITSGNTNAPTIMLAEKASDLILEDA